MSAALMGEFSQTQRDRLAFVDLRLQFLGVVRRHDLVARFGIQSAAATRDLAHYRRLSPSSIEYDAQHKNYRRTAQFTPLFNVPLEQAFTWLSNGYADREPALSKGILPNDRTALPGRLDCEVLATVTRAIHDGCALELAYRSLSSGLTTREIVPFALADSGLRWHVRAFDRRSGEFRDFALGRIDSARDLVGSIADHEHPEHDIQWNRITELELVPHPTNVRHPDTVEAELGMRDGSTKVKVRAAMAGYFLRRWNVDCSADHRLKGGEYQLWLRNRQALYGVNNLFLAPGYSDTGVEDSAC